MRTNAIMDSLKYYVDIEKIRKQEPARKYFVSIKQLFDFVFENSDCSNENLLMEFRAGTYANETNVWVNTNEMLLPKESLPTLSQEEVVELIEKCDNSFEKDYVRVSDDNTKLFKRVTICLCIKLMLLTGVSYGEIRKIKTVNLNVEESTIVINSFKIRLPQKFSLQLKLYFTLKNQNPNLKSIYLFTDENGNQLGERTSDSGIPGYTKTAIGKTSISSIIKFSIKQLLNNGANHDSISQLTGVSKEFLSDCIDEDDSTKERYINEKIINRDIYYLL